MTPTPPVTLAEAREFVALVCAVLEVPELAGKVVVSFNPRFTARMGDALYDAKTGRGRVRLSAPLWPKASRKEQEETVVHEACHVVAGFLYGRGVGHDHRWRALMARCGYSAAGRCHAVDKEAIAARRRARRVPIACGCSSPGAVGPVWVRRLQAGVKATCRVCLQPVRLAGPNPSTLATPSERPASR